MIRIPSYGKVFTLGHRDLSSLFDGPVMVQEKYDGSQVSWAWDDAGGLHVRSKGKIQFAPGYTVDQVDKLFRPAVEYLLALPFRVGSAYIFRGEALTSPKHHTLRYGRAPRGGIVLFDVELADNGGFLSPDDDCIASWAADLAIEPAQAFDPVRSADDVKALLEQESSLGGTPIEGVVIKNYTQTNPMDRRPFLAGKLVSERFKETHKREWKGDGKTVVERIIESLNTEARWEKAVQHLSEDGTLEGSPRDIGALLREVKSDAVSEERDWIMEKLAAEFLPQIERRLGRGLPEWYKERLLGDQDFGEGASR